jgi:hypothetical protein
MVYQINLNEQKIIHTADFQNINSIQPEIGNPDINVKFKINMQQNTMIGNAYGYDKKNIEKLPPSPPTENNNNYGGGYIIESPSHHFHGSSNFGSDFLALTFVNDTSGFLYPVFS